MFMDFAYLMLVSITSYLCFGQCSESEPGDLNINAALLISILLAVSVTFLFNHMIKRRNRKNSYIK